MKRSFAFAAGVALLFLPTMAASSASAPIRHVVYSFTWGIQNDTEEHSSGIGVGGSGIQNYRAELSDQGDIAIDVLRSQPDSGLVLTVSEHAQKNRSAEAAECVVYGNTSVICDPNKKINPEELTVVRFMGTNFVDPALIDAHQHWKIQSSAQGFNMTADYTIKSNKNGALDIGEDRNITTNAGGGNGVSQVTTTLSYDVNRVIPTWISEYTIERGDSGRIGQHSTTKSQIELKLLQDSGVKQK